MQVGPRFCDRHEVHASLESDGLYRRTVGRLERLLWVMKNRIRERRFVNENCRYQVIVSVANMLL